MKKIVAFIASLVFITAGLGCTKNETAAKVYVPDGAPALAMASLMAEDKKIDGKKYVYTVVPTSSIGERVAADKPEFAIVPTNMAVNLAANGAKYKMISINTYGNLFITTSGVAQPTLGDLKGKVVASIGRGQVPTLVLKAVLKKLDIPFAESDKAVDANTVSIVYAADGATAIGLVKAGSASACVLGEPAATGSLKQIAGAGQIDMQTLYASAFDTVNGFPQACMIAAEGVSDARIAAVLDALAGNAAWCAANADAAVQAIENHMIEGAATTVKALTGDIITRCHLVVKKAADVKVEVNTFLTAIGSALPGDGFFYA